MKELYMEMVVRIPDAHNFPAEDISWLSFGGYVFEISGNLIPFGFEGYSSFIDTDNNGQFIRMHTSSSECFRLYDIDTETYESEYSRLGLQAEDITASFLASATRIADFHFAAGLQDGSSIGDDFILEDVVFLDEDRLKYHLSPELLGTTINTLCNLQAA